MTEIKFPEPIVPLDDFDPDRILSFKDFPFISQRADLHLQRPPDDRFWFQLASGYWLIAVITPEEARSFALHLMNHESARREFDELVGCGWEVIA